MSSTINSLIEINAETMETAKNAIVTMAETRKLVLTGNLVLQENINFPSTNQRKDFKKLLERVSTHPTMKSVSIFLRKYSKLTGTPAVKIDYSAQEKKIQETRKVYLEARKKAAEAQARYKEEKGDFYKSAHLVVNS